jgi:hypothetical protein
MYGYNYTVSGNEVEIDINQGEILDSIPDLQKMGAINPDLTETGINMNKTLISTMTGLYFTAASMSDIYNNKNLDKLHFKAYLIVPDDYGNDKKHLVYSFNFSKDLNGKINWDNMTVDRFMKISPNFKFSDWYAASVSD